VQGVPRCISPKAVEEDVCDGVDQNCDGIQDDDVCATLHLEAVADTYVYEYNNSTHGSDTSLGVSFESDKALVRFDLTSVPSNAKILSVRFELTADYGWCDVPDTVDANLVHNDTWDEYYVSIVTEPNAETSPSASWFISDEWGGSDRLLVSADPLLIAPVEEAIESDKLLSFKLSSQNCITRIYSREWGNVAQRPQLVVQYTDKP
jgi:hypothetical protein